MIERNDKEYLKVLKVLNRLKLCHCFETLTYDEEDVDNDDNSEIELDKSQTYDTCTLGGIPMTHQVHEVLSRLNFMSIFLCLCVIYINIPTERF